MSGLNNARFRLLGGSTNFWGGQIVRFDQLIFEPRPWMDSPGWPFGRKDLDPYYDRVARLMGLQDDFSDQELWQRVGLKTPNIGKDLEVFLTRCLINRSTADIFKRQIDSSSFKTLVHANVIGMALSNSGALVSELALRSLSGRSGVVKAKKVVLACGTVEIIRLLLSPLSSGEEAPWSRHPWLGKGFIDHIEAIAGKLTLTKKQEFHHAFDNLYIDRIKYFPRVKFSPEAQKSREVLDVAGRFEFRSQYKEHLDNMKLFARSLLNGRRPDNLGQLPAHLGAVWKVALPLMWRYVKSKRAFNPTDMGIDFVLMSEQWPTMESNIEITQGQNALGAPRIKVNWTIDGRELETMATFAETVEATLEEQGLAKLEIDPLLFNRDPRFMDKVLDYYHQMGGARIGRDSRSGVVDANLKVFGTDNLFVAGAAVYPFSGFGNPTYTAMALGLRLCDYLKGTA
jgi:hypothetical protein